jgi:hypothetical protein
LTSDWLEGHLRVRAPIDDRDSNHKLIDVVDIDARF